MSRENVEIVRRATEAALRRPTDWDTVNDLYHPRHELISLVGRMEGASDVGDQGWRDWLERMDETGQWRGEVDEIHSAPEGRVVLTARFWLRGSRSGAETERPLGAVVTVRDGKIVRAEMFPTPEEALEAAGLRDG
jgi:ketosteroid isomerase-like protein